MKKILMYFVSSLFLLTIPAGMVSAATLSLSALPATPGVGDTFQVTLTMDSNTSVNAFSGTLVYSGGIQAVGVSDGSSIVSIWITHPSLTVGTDTVAFAGLTPGGYSGMGGKMFSVLFHATAPGAAEVSLSEHEVLQNDGAGTEEPTIVTPLSLSIGTVPKGSFTEPRDTNPPEPFDVYLNHDTEEFSGQYFLVFSAVDKSSGIDHYEAAETRLPFPYGLRWKTVQSPYLLADQYLTSTVYIKAVDRDGNARITVLYRRHILRPHEEVLLVCVAIILFFFWYWRRRDLIANTL